VTSWDFIANVSNRTSDRGKSALNIAPLHMYSMPVMIIVA